MPVDDYPADVKSSTAPDHHCSGFGHFTVEIKNTGKRPSPATFLFHDTGLFQNDPEELLTCARYINILIQRPLA